MSEYNPDSEPFLRSDDKYFECSCFRSQSYYDSLDVNFDYCNTCFKKIEEERNEND